MAKKKAEEKALNLDQVLFNCRDYLRAARNSGSFFEKRDILLALRDQYDFECSPGKSHGAMAGHIPSSMCGTFALQIPLPICPATVIL